MSSMIFLLFFSGASSLEVHFITDQDFYTPTVVRVDGKHRIFVVDSGDHKVRVYDAEGKSLFQMGRKGQGPGEFQQPSSVGFLADGRVLVGDSSNRRVHLFDEGGGFIRVIKITNQPVGHLLVLPNQNFVLSRTGGGMISIDMEKKKITRFNVFDLEGRRIRGFGEFQTHENPLLMEMLNRGALDLLGDKLVYAGGIQNELLVYAGDEVVKAKYPIKFTPREPKAVMKQSEQDGNISFRMSVEVDPLCIGLAVLSAQELLLMRYTSSDEEAPLELVKIDFEGQLLKAYPGRFQAIDMTLSPDKHYLYFLNNLEEEVVVSRLTL